MVNGSIQIPAVSVSRSTARGVVLVLIVVAMFAMTDAVSKMLAARLPVPLLVWVRYVVHATLTAAVFLPRMGRRLFAFTHVRRQFARAALMIATNFLVFFSLKLLPLAETTALLYLTPVCVVVISALTLGEHIGTRARIAVLMGLIGVILIVQPGSDLVRLPALVAIAAAICNGIYHVVTGRLAAVSDPIVSHFLVGLIGAAALSPVLLIDWHVSIGLTDIVWMVCLGAGASTGHLLLMKAFEHASPASLAPFTYAQVAWGTLLGYLVFGMLPDAWSMLGIVVVVASGLIVALPHFVQGWRASASQADH